MKIKVCGMKNPENISNLALLPINYMGLIFYSKSLRYIGNLDPMALDLLPASINRVGVFVNENIEVVLDQISKYRLNYIQLHGNESTEYCFDISNLSDVKIIKAFNIATLEDLEQTIPYQGLCDFFLFDTKTPQHGGSGVKFDWKILNSYKGETPFFLSGGISASDVKLIRQIDHKKLYSLDLNSKFEIEPGLKDIELLGKFIKDIRYE